MRSLLRVACALLLVSLPILGACGTADESDRGGSPERDETPADGSPDSKAPSSGIDSGHGGGICRTGNMPFSDGMCCDRDEGCRPSFFGEASPDSGTCELDCYKVCAEAAPATPWGANCILRTDGGVEFACGDCIHL